MKTIKKYLITLLVGLIGVGLILYVKDIFAQTEAVKIFHILCDAFFVMGVVITGFGLLVFTSNEGVFDGLVFAVGSFFNMFRRPEARKYATYFDYKASREDKKFSFAFLVIVGVFFIAVSLIMYLLYRQHV